MKTCSLSEAKSTLGKLADAALRGQPTVIPRGGKLVILQAYELPDHPDEFDALIQAGKASPHRPLTKGVLAEIWQHGQSLPMSDGCATGTSSQDPARLALEQAGPQVDCGVSLC